MNVSKKKIAIIGAGPAGLTAAAELIKTGQFSITVIEKENVIGGLARTTEYKGCRYDIGPHHFITESPKILAWWQEIMGNDFLKLQRLTRILYKKHFFNYPLIPLNVIKGLAFKECFYSVVSYIKVRLFPIKSVKSFQDWITNRFGARLFSIFFKTYTEKVWGISCNKISADWASQRIKEFSLGKAIFYAFFGRWFTKNIPRTIQDTFYYPINGAGSLWQKVADNLMAQNVSIIVDSNVFVIEHEYNKIVALQVADTKKLQKNDGAGSIVRHAADYFLSTMPLRNFILAMNPLPAEHIVMAAKSLCYRGLITVNLIINKPDVCPDHWLYIHEKHVRHGRIGNMNNFSFKMVDNAEKHTALSLEFFTFTNEPFWQTSDKELIQIGARELVAIGLIKEHDVLDGMVMKTADAYPVYDEHYKEHLSIVLDYLATFDNLQLMGRNGMHRYNNMDVAMLSAMTAVDIILKKESHISKKHIFSNESAFLT